MFGLSFTTQSSPCALWEALLAASEGFAVSVFLLLKVDRLCFKRWLEKYVHLESGEQESPEIRYMRHQGAAVEGVCPSLNSSAEHTTAFPLARSVTTSSQTVVPERASIISVSSLNNSQGTFPQIKRRAVKEEVWPLRPFHHIPYSVFGRALLAIMNPDVL